jgi:hypothetical protein
MADDSADISAIVKPGLREDSLPPVKWNNHATRGYFAAALFVAAALLHLLPVWRVRYIPTVDGPSHLLNAVVQQELAREAPEFARVFEVDWRPHPNWLAQALLRALLAIVRPLYAEKILFSIIILSFLGAAWMLAGLLDEGNRIYAFLALPLTFHLLLQMGFYSYSLGVPLLMISIALWWRNRTAAVAAMLVVCYFAHAVPAAMAMLLIATGSLVSRRHRRNLLALLPAASLFLWFFLQPLPGGHWTWKGAFLLQPLIVNPLIAWGTVFGCVFAVLVLLSFVLRPAREGTVFIVMTALAVAVFLAAPVSLEEGFVLKARLLIFPFLVALPWLTPRLAKPPLAIAIAIAAAVNVFAIRNAWKECDRQIAGAIAPVAAAETHRTFLPLVFDHSAAASSLPVMSHAVEYAAVDRRLVDLSDYEAALGFFPVRYKAGVQRPSTIDIETQPGSIDLNRYAGGIDYVYTWKMPAGAPVEKALAERYTLVRRDGDAALYRRR